MKTIGMIGGMSWESSSEYYRLINQKVRERLGGLHSAKCLMYSVEFAEIEAWMRDGKWDRIESSMVETAKTLENAGADAVLICTNTIHKVAEQVESQIQVPLLHIADAAGEALKAAGISRAGLLGTRFTMEEDFYRKRLSDKFGLEVVVPEKKDRELVDRVIFDELCVGIIEESSRDVYVSIMKGLAEQGAGGIVLGCTEIGLLVSPDDSKIPLFDTTEIHAAAAVDFALSG